MTLPPVNPPPPLDASPEALPSLIPRRWATLRELSAAALPALLAMTLSLTALSPALGTYLDDTQSWTIYPYYKLSNNLSRYALALTRPGPEPAAAGPEVLRQIVRSSLHNPAEFSDLARVEARGSARLAHIRAEFERGHLGAAMDEADLLSTQAHVQLNMLRATTAAQLQRARVLMLLGAVLSGALSMGLTLRALLFWRLERRRRESDRIQTRQLGQMASHELRRPLQQLMLVGDLLRANQPPEERARLLGLLQDSAAQIALRADPARLEAVYAEPQLNLVRTDLRELLWPLTGERVRLSLPPAPLPHPVDPARLRQSLENLVENALKYTAGEVRVSLHPGPEIWVEDDGPGIPDADAERVFEPFARLGTPDRAASPDGLGLGLTIARRFARAHGGDLLLAPAPGGGLRARLVLGPGLERAAVRKLTISG